MLKNKFFLPASSMLASLLVWIVFLIFHKGQSQWFGTCFCLAAAGLMVFSAYICRHVRGPRIGNFIRTGLLVTMTAITGWRGGIADTVVLALAAIVVGVVALVGPRPQN
jgi:hypothetical protein